ncbi:MAG: uroporphyrinogen decarboxylase [Candidatus Zixiibacteriota bacterium]
MSNYKFIKAAFGQPHEGVPIWIMRQAGRYLPEFQAVRDKISFMDLCRSPEHIAEVTMQPIDIFGFDAAILFSDILIPLEPLGVDVSFDNGGPRVAPTVRSPQDVKNLKTYNPVDEMIYPLQGIKEIKKRLDGRIPLIGFCGAPFTLACYLIEGGGTQNFTETKKFIYNYPAEAASLLNHLADITGRYLKAQIEAGADAVQLFDSWGLALPPEVYKKYSFPFIKTVFEICKTEGVPRILYVNNTTPYLGIIAELECEVISIDWRTEIARAASILDGKSLQGNLDPHVLFGSGEFVCREAARILEATVNMDGFIFNLGHGILPDTPVENVHILVDTVHAFHHGK